MVDYNLLTEMLEEALAKETSESLNKWLDDCFEDSHLINAVSTLDVSTLYVSEPIVDASISWNQGKVVVKSSSKGVADDDNQYAIAA